MLSNVTYAYPEFLYLLILLPVMAGWYVYKYMNGYTTIQLSNTKSFENAPRSYRIYIYHVLAAIRLAVVALLIVALARPQSSTRRQDVSIEGIDIVLALDVSSSMLARDLKPDRLEAAKDVAMDFFSERPNDRVGLVIFAGETFTQCPLTTDHSVLKALFEDIESGMIEDGTAIGDGMATAINRLRDSEAISKVIILLTDGVNNAGSLDPASAAEIAEMYGIRIYTIGVGSRGTAPYPVQTPFGIQMQNMEVQIDEELLQQVAEMTDGKYFRATSTQGLEEIYSEIDQLEKSKIDVTEFQKLHEEFFPLALLALGLLVLEILLRNLWFRTTP